jgi:hypothetical protein
MDRTKTMLNDIVEIYNVINFIEDISPVNLTKRTM